jgi:hypothetical protein
MLNLYEAKDEELMITTREIRNTMQKRGWPKVMKMYAGGQSQILAMRPDGKEVRLHL